MGRLLRWLRCQKAVGRLMNTGHDHMSSAAFDEILRQARQMAGYPH